MYRCKQNIDFTKWIINKKINLNFKLKKRNFKIGYFGSLYKSRGVDLVFELSKIDKKINIMCMVT